MVTRKSCGCLVNEYDEVIEVCPDHWYWFRTFQENINDFCQKWPIKRERP